MRSTNIILKKILRYPFKKALCESLHLGNSPPKATRLRFDQEKVDCTYFTAKRGRAGGRRSLTTWMAHKGSTGGRLYSDFFNIDSRSRRLNGCKALHITRIPVIRSAFGDNTARCARSSQMYAQTRGRAKTYIYKTYKFWSDLVFEVYDKVPVPV
jgi:hypothetical protein